MRIIEHIYIDGAFVVPHGRDTQQSIDPNTEDAVARIRLADAIDARHAIAAATRALPTLADAGRKGRIAMLKSLADAVLARADDLRDATIREYGAPRARAEWTAFYAAQAFLDAAHVLKTYPFERQMGTALVTMEPVGVAALITPWNSNAGSVASKLASALAAGCSAVIKPSELSGLQTHILTEALHAAGLPAGVFNIVTGRGDTVGAEFTDNPDVARISFTGSTAVGKSIMRAASDSVKRVSLALGGKSPTIILDDAELESAVELALGAAFQNNGQACIAGSRLLVPAARLGEVVELARTLTNAMKVGDPSDAGVALGPLASRRQLDRVRGYIGQAIEQGATLVAGGLEPPAGLARGYFVRPTVFSGVTPDMTIAREEVFGPVLAIMAYQDEDDAVTQANDSAFGLQAYVISRDAARAQRVARRLQAGRVLVNTLQHEPLAPFGGRKQSGIGREFGVFGLEAFLEPKAIVG